MAATLDFHDDIAVLTLGDDENRFSPAVLESIAEHLDRAESAARGLVTVGSGKYLVAMPRWTRSRTSTHNCR
ncbi:hypothetical protein R4144_13370 [Gordonia amicalis]|uniref:hypothetical protein n=1 Tax=Gordonia amicalis TaxID=89053 RepID=UPI002954655E|nr:hypothetical protein [Gordonia amicalis]MDV7174349.1 hypothetical protein [Gordonia amicalis]